MRDPGEVAEHELKKSLITAFDVIKFRLGTVVQLRPVDQMM